MDKREGLLEAIGRRVLTGVLSVAMSVVPLPATSGHVVARAQDAGQQPDGVDGVAADARDTSDGVGDEGGSADAGTTPSASGEAVSAEDPVGDEDPQEGDEPSEGEDAPSRPPAIRRISLGRDPLFEVGDDGVPDTHPEVTLSGEGELFVEVEDADQDLRCQDSGDGRASRVEVRGSGEGVTVSYPLRYEDEGACYVPDTESGAIDLAESGDYTITVVLADADPTQDLVYSRQVAVDLETPTVSVTWGPEGPGEPGGSVFAARTATIEVVDERLVQADPMVRAEGGDLSLAGWERSVDGRRAWATVSFGEGTYSSLVVSASDGVHDVELEALDGAEFVVDRTAPVISSVEVEGLTPTAVEAAATLDPRELSALGPAYLKRGLVRVRVEEKRLRGLEVRSETGEALPVWEEGAGLFAFELPEGPCPGLRITARDEAGNVSEPALVAAGALVVDGTAPTIDSVTTSATGSPALAAEGARLGSKASTLTVCVSDANLAPQGCLAVEAKTSAGSSPDVACDLVAREDGTCRFELTLPDGTYPSVTFVARDLAGNEVRRSFTDVLVDTVAPRIGVTDVTQDLRRGVSWDDTDYDYLLRQDASGDLLPYFRRPAQCVVEVEEGHLCEGESALEVDGAWAGFPDGTKVRWGDTQRVSDDVEILWQHTGERYTCTVTYEDLGQRADLRLTPLVRVADTAGNVSVAGEQRQAFVVDTTGPAIGIVWGTEEDGDPEPSNVSDGRAYYASARTATVTLADANWDLSQGMGDVLHVIDADADQPPVSDWEVVPAEGGNPSLGTRYVARFRDGDYGLWAEGHDLAGNHTEERGTQEFVVDTTRPVIDVTFEDEGAANGRYYDAPRTMTVSVTERNFDPGRIRVEVTTTASDHDSDPSGDVNDPSRWEDEGDRHTFTYRFGRDGTYAVDVTGSDLAINEAVPVRVDEFVIDQTAPKVSVSARRPADATLAGTGYYRQPIAWDVTIRDRNLDVVGAQASVATIACGNATVGPVRAWERTEEAGGMVSWHTTVLFDELDAAREGQASQTPQVHATDLAGNLASEASHPFYVDRTAPSIVRASVSRDPVSSGSGEDYQFFNQPTSMSLAFHDAYGLGSATLVDPDGEYVMRGSVVPGSHDGTLSVELVDGTRRTHDTEYERDVTLTVTDVAGNVRVWTIDRQGNVVDDRGSSADNLSLDGRGVYPLSLVEDVTAPRVALTGPEAGVYYASSQTFHVAVDEFNLSYLKRFDPSRAVVRITRTAAHEGQDTSSWDVPVSALMGSGSVWELDQTLEEEGHYTLAAGLTDFAENRSNEVVIGEFTIDRTAPVISVAWDNEDVRNGRYYHRSRTATVTVVEHDFDPALMALDTTGSAGPWTGEGDTHTCLVSFGEGVHHLSVSGSDLAGNASNEVDEPEFVVDTTAPTVEIGGVAERTGAAGDRAEATLEDHGAYNGVVRPRVQLADEANLDAASVTLSLTGARGGEVLDLFDHDTDLEGNREVVLFSDLGLRGDGTYDVGADDVYVLRASVADLAGNTAEAELTFSVNRFGSNFIVSVDGRDVTAGGGTLLTEPPEVRVREINVSGVAREDDRSVLKEYANLTTPIERDDGDATGGYRLEAVLGGDGPASWGWAEYLYTIRSGNFGEGSDSDAGDGGQGVYRVNVVSDDAASNANSTASFWEPDEDRASVRQGQGTAQFTLDELGPAIDSVVLPENVAVGSAFEASFHVSDAITTGDEVEVTVDGERVEVSGPSDGRGAFAFQVPARSFARRAVRIVVRDYAGRTDSVEAEGLYVTDLVGEGVTACGVTACIVGTCWAARRRHRRGYGRGGE